MADGGNKRVFVTGVGPVTSIGVGADAFWRALERGRCAVAPRQLHIDMGVEVEIPVASMPPALPIIKPHHEFLERQDYAGYRDLAYALAGIDLALEDARLEHDRQHNNIGVIQAFEAPGMERSVATMFETCGAFAQCDGPPRLYDTLAPCFYNSQGFLYVHAVGKAFGFHGFSTSVHNACSSGAYAVELAADRIRSGDADIMIACGGESFDTGVRVEWFRQLGLYVKSGAMRPFDPESDGFYVGEGGAAVVLESESSVARRGATPYAEYLGGFFAQQGWKHSIPDVRADRLTKLIKRSLQVHGGDIDVIVPHGAATPISDGYEAMSLQRGLDGKHKDAVATVFKPHVGHTLAASSLIELIASLLAMRHGLIPATLNSRSNCGKLCVPLITENTQCDIRSILKISTGFTGHDAAALYRAVS